MKVFSGSIQDGVKYIRESTSVFRAMRPLEWIKNVFVFAPLFFSGQAAEPQKLAIICMVFLAFSAMSSAIYLLNDITDANLDRIHPQKRFRPIASGQVSIKIAGFCAIALAFGSLASLMFLPKVFATVLVYGLLNILYCLWFKNLVIIDVFCIALGFVLRVFAGGLAINVTPSSWLVLATFLLSLFLALAKRRHELLIMEKGAIRHRPVLEHYSLAVVDELISVVTPVTLITYILYTLDPTTINHFNSRLLYLTSVFVMFGIFRYLFLVHKMNVGGSPANLVVKDLPLLFAVLGWVTMFFVIVYFV